MYLSKETKTYMRTLSEKAFRVKNKWYKILQNGRSVEVSKKAVGKRKKSIRVSKTVYDTVESLEAYMLSIINKT